MQDLKPESDNMDNEQEARAFQQEDRKRKSFVGAHDDELVSDREEVDNSSKAAAVNVSKKKRKEDAEAMQAETQRLLRESKKVAFPEGQLQQQKPISSVLEKMRQRKLERAQRSAQQGNCCFPRRPVLDIKNAIRDDGSLNVESDEDIELVMVKPPTQQVAVKQEPRQSTANCKFRSIATSVGSIEETSRPSTPETRSEGSRADKTSVVPNKPESCERPAWIDSQDLYSDSQLSPIRDEALDTRDAGDNVHLPELDSEMQTEYCSSPEDDKEKENKDPARGVASIPTVSRVRGLIDDEAEDEDEDLLEDEEEDDDDSAEDLQDMLAHDVSEKPADRKRRARLHRKWLEQQDMSMTDSILNRLENGWKNKSKKQRLPGILDEAEDSHSGGTKSQATNETTPPANSTPICPQGTCEKTKNQELKSERSVVVDVVLGVADANTHESDDEEEDEQFRRQRLLTESEEQSELPSVHDDEASRQIFSLINKANIATTRTTKVTLGLSDLRPLPMVHLNALSNVQSSFARRTVATSVQATTRQGSGNSRSYVFGRDDSNGNHISRFHGNESKSGNDSSPAMAAGDNQTSNSRISSAPRRVSSVANGSEGKAAETTGPSLFQILRQQAADLERSILTRDTSFSLNGNSSHSGDLSIFSVMKPSKLSRKSRG